jgi:UDP-N-acetylmuramoyl-tripeptide--D-alanyl-D-alanine ligase
MYYNCFSLCRKGVVMMKLKIKISDIIAVTGGSSAPGSDGIIDNIVIDSREAAPGSLFVAFAGENVDGHDFVADSFSRGAVAALVEREVAAPRDGVVIRVDSTEKALQRLAAWQRDKFPDLQVLAITGSSGKTTTKELVARVLGQEYNVLKSRGNKNNEIGLPLTMFEIREEHQWAVLEMGMAAPGEIRQLCAISRPGIGVLTNIGEAHILHLGTQEAIMRAKFELAENLQPPAVMILNGDDPWQRRRAQEGLPGVERVVWYGIEQGDVTAANIVSDIHGNRFDLSWQGGQVRVNLPLPGSHNVSNALAAFAVGLELGIAPESIVRALNAAKGEKRRLHAFGIRGFTVIDDSYNANPDSTSRALELLGNYPANRRKVAFLGSMLELGEVARERHELIGAVAVENNVRLLVAVGENAQDIRRGAIAAGMDSRAIVTWPDSEAALASLELLRPGDVVLIKGSLGVKMDRIVQELKDGGQ